MIDGYLKQSQNIGHRQMKIEEQLTKQNEYFISLHSNIDLIIAKLFGIIKYPMPSNLIQISLKILSFGQVGFLPNKILKFK